MCRRGCLEEDVILTLEAMNSTYSVLVVSSVSYTGYGTEKANFLPIITPPILKITCVYTFYVLRHFLTFYFSVNFWE